MIQYEDECVGCPPEIGCLGSGCPKKNVPHFFCDDCKDEIDPDDLYDVDGDMLCRECALDRIKAPADNWFDV